MNRLRLGALVVAALFAVPVAQAQIDNPDESTPTTLYFHVFDLFNNFVINTQAMDADFFEVGGTNFPTIPPTPVIAANGWDFNTIYGTSTAGPVEYDFIENGRPRFHPERGIAADVAIDPAVQPVSTLYFRAPGIGGSDASGPGLLPYLTARVTMRTGDDPGSDAFLDEGQIIMQGQTTVHLVSDNGVPVSAVAGSLPLDHPVAVPDEGGVIEIAVPMELAANSIPKAEAFNVRIDWYQWSDSPAGSLVGEDEVAQGNLKIVVDPQHLWRLDFAITNPVYIEFIHPQVAAGTLLIHTGVNSPWGTYDIDPANITLSVSGPSTPANLQQVVAQNQHVHGLHDQAAEITYLWKFRDEGADDGEYQIAMEVPNVAGTSTASGTGSFVIEGREAYGIADTGQVVEPTVVESQDSPAGWWPALLVIGAIGLVRRRT